MGNYFDIIEKQSKLIDIMLEYRDEHKICNISQAEIAKRLNIGQVRVGQIISQINREKVCIKKIAPGKYYVNKEIFEEFTVKKIKKLQDEALKNKEIMNMSEKDLAKKFNLKIKTIKAVLAIWRQNLAQFKKLIINSKEFREFIEKNNEELNKLAQNTIEELKATHNE
jgi:hypothetical protein|nr:MAG TPA: Selenocysteine-specific elongation factor [Inoviridae sp.]